MKNSIWKWAAGILVTIILGLGAALWNNLEGRVQTVEVKQQITDADIALERAAKRLNDLEKRRACHLESDDYETCKELERRIKRLGGQIDNLEKK